MINSKDVRVGNWLLKVYAQEKNSRPGINYQPKAVTANDFGSLNTCLPIPLTIALLEKCGFIYEEGVWCKYQQVGEGRALVLKRKQKEEWYVRDHKIKAPPFYLHQLQNLFYALTGKELKVVLQTYRVFDRSMVIL